MLGTVAIGLENPKTPANLGSVLRAAFVFDADMVAVSGGRIKPGNTDTPKAWSNGLPYISVDSLIEVIPFGCMPIAIEISPEATSLVDFNHPKNAFYIFGPEDGSVKKDTLKSCARIVSIPTKFCMNLAATVNVVLYDRLAKQLRCKFEG